MLGIELGEAIACVAGSVLAESIRPAGNWRGSFVNVLLGIAAGVYGPLPLEAYFERLKGDAHRFTVFATAFVGCSILKWLSEQAAERKFLEWMPVIKQLAEFLKKPPGGNK